MYVMHPYPHFTSFCSIFDNQAPVTALAFSCNALYLAIGDMANELKIYSTRDRDQVESGHLQGPIVSLAWHPLQEETLFVGLETGKVLVIQVFGPTTPMPVTPNNTWPISAISLSATVGRGQIHLAVLAGKNVYIAVQNANSQWGLFKRIALPGITSASAPKANPQRMMFIPGTYDLMIEYLNEGVMCLCVNTNSAKRLWQYAPPIGSAVVCASAVSGQYQVIVVASSKNSYSNRKVLICSNGSVLREVPLDTFSHPQQLQQSQLAAVPGESLCIAAKDVLLLGTSEGDVYAVSGWETSDTRAIQDQVIHGSLDPKCWRLSSMVYHEGPTQTFIATRTSPLNPSRKTQEHVVIWSADRVSKTNAARSGVGVLLAGRSVFFLLVLLWGIWFGAT